MDLGLAGRTALVLGSTAGLGLATAVGLAAEGAQVMICGRRDDLAVQRAEALNTDPKITGTVHGVGVDLSRPQAAAELIDVVDQRFGPIDIAVLNSGGPPSGAAADLQPEQIQNSLATMLFTQLEVVHLVLPGMRERRWGRILAVGSSGIAAPLPNLVQSNLIRAGLAAYLKTLAAEVAADGVTVNLVLPGRIETDRINQLDASASTRQGIDIAEVRRRSEQSIPAGRYGRPAEFGAATAFLCSEPASYVTGVALRVDGGLIRSL